MVGMEKRRTKAPLAINKMSRWPAVRLAVRRTPRAIGRMKRLMVSMIISTGIRGVGVPSGRRWPSACVGWFRSPIITVASQRGTASPRFKDSWVVGVNVYGRRPNMFSEMRRIIREAKSAAHLWPPGFRGRSSCWVKRLRNHPWRVSSRLFSHWRVARG